MFEPPLGNTSAFAFEKLKRRSSFMFVYVWRAPPLQNNTPYTLSYQQNFRNQIYTMIINISRGLKTVQNLSDYLRINHTILMEKHFVIFPGKTKEFQSISRSSKWRQFWARHYLILESFICFQRKQLSYQFGSGTFQVTIN